MGFSSREKCKQAISAGFQNCWLPVLLNCVLGYSFSSSLNKELRTATGLSEMWEPLWNHWEAFRWSTLFLLTQLSHQGPVPILGCLSDVSEVREQLSNLSELASDERKEVKGIVISPLEFFLCGEEEIVFVAPVGFFFFGWGVLMRLSYQSWEWDHSWPVQKEEGGLVWAGDLGLYPSVCCFLRCKQTFFFLLSLD